ncbi:MAG: HAD family phosphatase [Patescibacteria group bacterium]
MNNVNLGEIKAVLFDLDGVLVNMPVGHYEALNKALGLFGVHINEEEHYGHFNGLPTRKKLETLEQQKRLPIGLREFINGIKQKYTKEIIPQYCAPDYSKIILLRHLKEQGFKLGCCSNSTKETLHLMLKSAQLFDFFDIIIGNDEVANPKPSPEIYQVAFGKLHVSPEECIIVEDSPHGIASGKASGATVYEVRDVDDVTLSLFENVLLK